MHRVRSRPEKERAARRSKRRIAVRCGRAVAEIVELSTVTKERPQHQADPAGSQVNVQVQVQVMYRLSQ